MSAQEQLKEIFGVDFEEKQDLSSVQAYEAPNTYCKNEAGDIIAIHSSENSYSHIRIPESLSKLQYLNLSDNKELRHLEFDIALSELYHFDVSDSVLEELTFPAGLKQLKWLDASRNKLKNVSLKGAFPALSYLDLSDNQIRALDIPDCPKLVDIYAQKNKIGAFNISAETKALSSINLKENQLNNLPQELAELKNLNTLLLYNNPLSDIPSAIVSEDEYGNSAEAVQSYLLELKKANITNDRAKLIIVGNGRVGKTSLRHRLGGEAFNLDEEYTHGIEFEKLIKENLPEVKTEELQLQVWDFGGQEIFYATHQFFLTEEAIYILAWTNEENVKPYREKDKETLPFDEKWRSCEYWLENIRLHGNNSPIIMVQTHRDIRVNRLPEDPEWRNKYGVDSLSFSAKKDFGLDELKDIICEYLNDGKSIPLFGKEFALSYDNVIAAVEHRKKNENHITKEQFYALCASVGIEKGNEHLVLDYLKKTGLVVYFDKPLLSDTVFINPNWLTDQVYKLINNDLRPREGKIDKEYLEKILPTHSSEMRARFIELLKAFELIFQPQDEEYFVSPQYLPEHLESTQQEMHDILLNSLSHAFTFKFPKFLPDNVIINFLSQFGPYSKKLFWRNGLCFIKNETSCIVHFNPIDDSLQVYCQNSEHGKSLQREVCKSFIDLSKKAYAEISIDGQHFVEWEKLEKHFELLRENPKQKILATDGVTHLEVLAFSTFSDKGEMLFHLRQEIEELVIGNNLEAALTHLSNLIPADAKGEVIQLQRRLTQLSRDLMEDILDSKDAKIEKNKITKSILSLCERIDKSKIRRK